MNRQLEQVFGLGAIRHKQQPPSNLKNPENRKPPQLHIFGHTGLNAPSGLESAITRFGFDAKLIQYKTEDLPWKGVLSGWFITTLGLGKALEKLEELIEAEGPPCVTVFIGRNCPNVSNLGIKVYGAETVEEAVSTWSVIHQAMKSRFDEMHE